MTTPLANQDRDRHGERASTRHDHPTAAPSGGSSESRPREGSWRWRGSITDIVLVALAIGASVWVAFDLTRPSAIELSRREGLLLQALSPEDIRRLTLQHADTPPFTVTRHGEEGRTDWRFGDGGEPAADEAVDAWLAALRLAAPRRRVTSEATGAPQYGLDLPRAVLAIEAGPISYRLVLGNRVPGADELEYVQVSGDGIPDPGIVVLASATAAQLFPQRRALLSRRLLGPPPSEWQTVVIRDGETELGLERKEDGGFVLAGPDGVRLARDVQRRLELALVRLEAQPLLDFSAAQRAQPSDSLSVSIDASAPAATWRIRLGGACPEGPGTVALRLAPTERAGCVPSDIVDLLPRSLEDAADRRLFAATFDQVERLEVEHEGERLVLARDETGFRLLSPAELPVPLEQGNEFLRELTEAAGVLVEGRAPTSSSSRVWSGKATLSLTRVGDEPSREIIRFSEMDTEGRRLVERVADGQRLWLAAPQAALLSDGTRSLLPLEIFSFGKDDVRRVSVTEGEFRQVITRDRQGVFSLLEPSHFEVNQSAAAAIFDAVASLTAKRRLPSGRRNPSALTPPVLKLEILVDGEDGTRVQVLQVGQATPEGHVAHLPGTAERLLLPHYSIDALRRLAIDGLAFACGPAELASIRLSTPIDELRFSSTGTTFVATNPDAVAGDWALEEVLSGLEPLGIVHLGAPRAYEGAAAPVLRVGRTARPGAPAACGRELVVGTADAWRGHAIRYAWLEGLDAVFALPRSRVEQLLGREG